jgi:hypothetical protein
MRRASACVGHRDVIRQGLSCRTGRQKSVNPKLLPCTCRRKCDFAPRTEFRLLCCVLPSVTWCLISMQLASITKTSHGVAQEYRLCENDHFDA